MLFRAFAIFFDIANFLALHAFLWDGLFFAKMLEQNPMDSTITMLTMLTNSQCLQTHNAYNAHKRTILTTLTITTKSPQSSVCSLQWSVQWRSRVCLSAPGRHRCPNPDRFREAGEPRAARCTIAEPPIDFNPTTFREEPKNTKGCVFAALVFYVHLGVTLP